MTERRTKIQRQLDFKLGEILKGYREASGLSKQEVCKRSGMPRDNYTRYEAGMSSMPLQRLMEVAEIYGVTVCDILEHIQPVQRKSKTGSTHIKMAAIFSKLKEFVQKSINVLIRELGKGK